jgi:ABC-type uncharacterized transport system substrate-binding protein
VRAGWIAAAWLGAAGGAEAHPHVWIDARVEVLLDAQDRAVALRIDWTYDDFFSLYVIGDMGLDPDWDGALTEAETARLAGFDMNWDAGFPGDTYALDGDQPVALSRPEETGARYDGGKITSSHLRRLDRPVPAADLVVQAYDPGYYTAYAIATGPVVTGGSGACSAQVFVPDLSQAEQVLKDALSEYTPEIDLEAEFPAVGAAYAEEVRIACAGG